MSIPKNAVITIVGNRPHFVKLAPISAELAKRGHSEVILHTGQHYDENMSDVFFDELGISPPTLRMTVTGRKHGALTGELLAKLEETLESARPRGVLLFGDTNSTLAAALAAVKLHIPIAHVEAGPRLGGLDTPEEVNRKVADNVSQLLFCPDMLSVQNLARENIVEGVHFTGDVMYDAFLHFLEASRKRSTVVDSLGLRSVPYALMTAHRPNNTDTDEGIGRLETILRETPMRIVFPVHPRTVAAFKRAGRWDAVNNLPNATLIPAVGYIDNVALIDAAQVVLTDSGGLQKEAFFAGKPTLMMFHSTPWPQIQANGWQHQVWAGNGVDVPATLELMQTFRPTRPRGEYFGDGRAAMKIVDQLEVCGWYR